MSGFNVGVASVSESLNVVSMCIELGSDSKETGPKAFWDALYPFTGDLRVFGSM